jgi:hypothetical protein
MCSSGPSRRARNYLRVAQTYMLISIPTCTSTIFGVFQVIRALLNKRKVTKAPAMFRSLGPVCETRASARLHHRFPYVAMRCPLPTKLAFSVVRRGY